jgi:23S rRNA (uracil1939-C5)-methyltransferase
MERFEINAMTFGPYGLGHAQGRTVMAAHVTPGDLVEAELIARRGSYAAKGTPRVLRPGRERREAPCAYLPRCGGCDWQHINYSAQVRFKSELLAGEFRRALGVALDPAALVEPAPAEFGYRSRIRLSCGPDGKPGYRELQSNRVVEVDRCLIAAGEVEVAHELMRMLHDRRSEIEIVTGPHGYILVARLSRAPSAREWEIARKVIAADSRIGGVILADDTSRIVVGDVKLTVEPEHGCSIEADADCFTQPNRAQNTKLVSSLIEMAELSSTSAVLDLFCGIGNFSLPVARRKAIVSGVDRDPIAIATARSNAVRMGLMDARFMATEAQEGARFLLHAGYRPDVVMLDPPRTGAAALMQIIAQLKARRVIYVSCDPPSLVRDMRALCTQGYRVGRVRGFDFFPNTHHIEAVAEALLT